MATPDTINPEAAATTNHKGMDLPDSFRSGIARLLVLSRKAFRANAMTRGLAPRAQLRLTPRTDEPGAFDESVRQRPLDRLILTQRRQLDERHPRTPDVGDPPPDDGGFISLDLEHEVEAAICAER